MPALLAAENSVLTAPSYWDATLRGAPRLALEVLQRHCYLWYKCGRLPLFQALTRLCMLKATITRLNLLLNP